MQEKDLQLRGQRVSEFRRLARSAFHRNGDIASNRSVSFEWIGSRKRQHIRRPVFPAKFPVEPAQLLVAGEHDGDFALEPSGFRRILQECGEGPLPHRSAESGLYRGFDQDHGPVHSVPVERPVHKTTVGGSASPSHFDGNS